MSKVNDKDTRICKVNDNVNNKVTVAVVLMSLLLTLNIFRFTEHIPLVSNVVRLVYPSGPTFEGKVGGVGRAYVWELYSVC